MKLHIEIKRFKIPHGDRLFGLARIYVYDGDKCLAGLRLNSLENFEKRIPVGSYKVVMTYSPKFKRQMLLVDGVAGRSGIRIHPFNYGSESKGCITFGLLRAFSMLSHTTLHCNYIENLYKICDSAELIIM